MTELLGSCLGQAGSTLNSGPSASASDAAKANPKKNTDAASLQRCDIDMRFTPIWCGEFPPHWCAVCMIGAAPAYISGLRRVDLNGAPPPATNYFPFPLCPERAPPTPSYLFTHQNPRTH